MCKSFAGHKIWKITFELNTVVFLVPCNYFSSLHSTNRASSECSTSGSCRYDNEVKSSCPIRMVGLRNNGKSFSSLKSITLSAPLSVHMWIFLSARFTSAAIVAPSQTFSACGIHIRAPYHPPINRNRIKQMNTTKSNQASNSISRQSETTNKFYSSFRFASHKHCQWLIVSHFKCFVSLRTLRSQIWSNDWSEANAKAKRKKNNEKKRNNTKHSPQRK